MDNQSSNTQTPPPTPPERQGVPCPEGLPDLPNTPGIYRFHGESGDLLYNGLAPAPASPQCAGACTGGNPAVAHNYRLRKALDSHRIAAWSYQGPVIIEEASRRAGRHNFHMVHDWHYPGTAAAATTPTPCYNSRHTPALIWTATRSCAAVRISPTEAPLPDITVMARKPGQKHMPWFAYTNVRDPPLKTSPPNRSLRER